MSTTCSMDELMPLIKEVMSRGSDFSFIPNGCSMLPLIVGGSDSVTLSPIKKRIKKGDIVLFELPDGKAVLHRAIKIRGDEILFCGDNRKIPECGVKKSMAVGVVSKIQKNGKTLNTKGLFLRLYSLKEVYSKRLLFLLRKIKQHMR